MSFKTTLLFQRIVPAYRLPLFQRLYERLGVIVCHSRERRGSSLKSMGANLGFPSEHLPAMYAFGKDSYCVQEILSPLIKHRPKVVICEFALGYGTLYLLLFLREIFGYRLLLWTHAIENEEVIRGFESLRSRFKLLLYRRMDGIICYSAERLRILRSATAPLPKLFLAPNTLDTDAISRARISLEVLGRDEVRKQLGIQEKHMLLFIGRLERSKGLDLLLDAWSKLTGNLDASLHIIGDGPERKRMEGAAAVDSRIKLHGAVHDLGATTRFMVAADVLVHPGAIGLALVHSFAAGLPVITCRPGWDGPFHGPEFEYLEPGVNGTLCDWKAAELALAIHAICDHPELRQSYSSAAIRKIQENGSIQQWLKGFEEALSDDSLSGAQPK